MSVNSQCIDQAYQLFDSHGCSVFVIFRSVGVNPLIPELHLNFLRLTYDNNIDITDLTGP